MDLAQPSLDVIKVIYCTVCLERKDCASWLEAVT